MLWFELDWLKEEGFTPDLKCKDAEKLPEKLALLADSIMSCKIPEEAEGNDEQNMLRDFVLEVQQHKHTGTCRKKKTILQKLIILKTALSLSKTLHKT